MDLEALLQEYFQTDASNYLTFDEFIATYIDTKVEA